VIRNYLSSAMTRALIIRSFRYFVVILLLLFFWRLIHLEGDGTVSKRFEKITERDSCRTLI